MIGLIIALLLAVALTVVSAVIILMFASIVISAAWYGLRERFFPSPSNRTTNNPSDTTNVPPTPVSVPHFLRRRTAHDGPVVALGVYEENNTIVSVGQDKTLRTWEMQWNSETMYPLPFIPGTLAVADHEEAGLRAAVGVFERDADGEKDTDIVVWELSAGGEIPRFSLTVPGLRKLNALAWNDTADCLRVLAAVYDPSHPVAPNNSSASPNRLALWEFDLRDASGNAMPTALTLPPALVDAEPWETDDRCRFALSKNGRWLACRTEFRGSDGSSRHGVGVWNVDIKTWEHRFGGREAQPHSLWAITKDGGRVFSSRQDDPGRDYRNGDPAWYDGLYLWDAHTSPPEGEKEAAPEPNMNSGYGYGLALNQAETLLANPIGAWGEVQIYDLGTRSLFQTIRRPHPKYKFFTERVESVWACAFCWGETERELVTGHYDGALWFWSLAEPTAVEGISS